MKTSHTKAKKPVLTNTVTLVKDLCSVSGKEIVGRILEHKSPGRVVQELPPLDFFWLVKRVGEDDCVPLLELASADQWQYLLDLELWRKDRLDLQQTSLWLKRLYQADHVRLMRWLFSEGNDFAFYFFSKSIQVFVREEAEPYDLPKGFFCIDRGLYIRGINSEHHDTLERIIRAMADEDFVRCRTFLLRLADLIPAEIEEEMYRLRNARLGEHGFFPFEEALSVYASLDPKRIGDERPSDLTDLIYKEEIRAMVRVSPLYSAGANNIVTKTASRITDPLFVDRIRLEFAGLCNQILSADGLPVGDAEVLIRACRKAAGYLNLALEGLCGNKIFTTEQLLRSHSLKSIFRVGFGLVLKLKWQAEQWFERSWFSRNGFCTGFWGEQWGAILAGLLEERPQLYSGAQEHLESKDFESLSELDECRSVLHRLMALDKLLGQLAELYPVEESLVQSQELTFYPLLFNVWARGFLRLEPSFFGITLDHVKDLFRRLRLGSDKPPYEMLGSQGVFAENLMAYASDLDTETAAVLEDTLSLILREFQEEYEWVSISDLGGRYSRFISIMPSPSPEVR